MVANCRDGMLGRDGRDRSLTKTQRLANADGLILHDRFLTDGDFAEIGPDRPVEDVILDDFQCGVRRIEGDRAVVHVGHRVDHQRQGGQMVEMRMGDEDVFDHRHFCQRQFRQPRPCIDQDVVINQHRGGAHQSPANTAATTENSEFHAENLTVGREPSFGFKPGYAIPAFARRVGAVIRNALCIKRV